MEYIFKVSKFFFSPLIVLTLKMIIWITKKEVVFGYEKKFYNVGASFYKIKSVEIGWYREHRLVGWINQ